MSRPIYVLFAGLLAVGCTRENKSVTVNGDSRYPACTSNAQCGAGTICTTIGCCPGCHSDADCSSTELCTINPAGNFCSPKTMSTNPPSAQPDGKIISPVANKVGPAQHCSANSDCAAGWSCNAGTCLLPCSTTADCGPGATCTAGRCYNDGASNCGSAGLATCAADYQCGTGRVCLTGGCHKTCTANSECPLGQACSGGACSDATPVVAQCTFDNDCGVAFRCINAACHPLCSGDTQCSAGNFCDHGVCRADYRISTL
jgi:Cys-rich repeat protein